MKREKKATKPSTRGPVATIGPNKSLCSQVVLSAVELGTFSSYLPVRPHLRNGIIDDETLGIDWAIENIARLQKATDNLFVNISSIRDLALLKFVGAIGPDEDPIAWVRGRVESMCERLVNQADFFQWFYDNFGAIEAEFGVYDGIQCKILQIIGDKDGVNTHLADQINTLAEFLILEHKDAIHAEDACGTAKEIIMRLADQLNEIGEFLLDCMTEDDVNNYNPDKDSKLSILKLLVNRDRAEPKLKRAALDDAMRQLHTANSERDDNARVLAQAGERLQLLDPNPGNFDQLLKTVLQYVVNNGNLLTTEQSKLLAAIAAVS